MVSALILIIINQEETLRLCLDEVKIEMNENWKE